MNSNEFFNYIKGGAQPVVRFDDQIERQEGCGFESGMMAKAISVEDDGDGVYIITFDFSDYELYNDSIDKRKWFDNNHIPCLKWSETHFYPVNKKEKVYWDFSFDTPFEIVDGQSDLFDQYKLTESKLSYVTWLENLVKELQNKL